MHHEAVIDFELIAGGAGKHGARFGVPASRTVENQHSFPASSFFRDKKQISNGIDTYRRAAADFGVGASKNSNRCSVSVGLTRKHQDLVEAGGNVDFIVDRIDANLIHAAFADDSR